MAKDPEDRFPSMEAFAAELRASVDGDDESSGAATQLLKPPRRPRRRERPARLPAERHNLWPLIVLLAGLVVVAGVLAAVFTFTDSSQKISDIIHDKTAAPSKPVNVRGVVSYDPDSSDKQEHNEKVQFATDGNPTTAWTTEHYRSGLRKPGVGLVLDAGRSQKLSKLRVTTDTPGFTAVIKESSSPSGGFTPVSKSQSVSGTMSFSLNGAAARYYLVWITSLGSNDHADVNEVTARSG
jgi:hypothetical protein